MSDYTQITDFSAKDALTSGDPEKVATGADVDAELAAIATAIASKADDDEVVKLTGTQTVAGDKTFSGNNTFSGTNVFSGSNTFRSSDAGASAGPTVTLHRDSASPAASDVIGALAFDGEDSGGTQTTYAGVRGEIVDPTDASEDGRLAVQSTIAGTLATRLYVGHGLYTVGATDQGANTLNATGVYQGGKKLGWEILDSGTESSVASVDFTGLTTDYRAYLFVFDGLVPATDAADFIVRTSQSSSFETGATDYVYNIAYRSNPDAAGTWNTTGTGTGDNAVFASLDHGSAAGEFAAGWVMVHNPADSSSKTTIEGRINYYGTATDLTMAVFNGARASAVANDGFQVLMSTGNISNMKWTLYGLRAS